MTGSLLKQDSDRYVTSLSFILVFILRSEALIQNVDHFSAEVYDEQRKSSLRHDEKSYCTVLLAAHFFNKSQKQVTAVGACVFLSSSFSSGIRCF